MPSHIAIQPLVIGDNAAALTVMAALREQGIWVPAIRPPTVPAGTARLRIALSAAHQAEDVDALLSALRAAAAGLSAGRAEESGQRRVAVAALEA
jgi:8-amino-7-oxononanoate synthase